MKSLRTVGLIALCAFCLCIGFGSGWFGARYNYIVLPEKKARAEAEKRQKELDAMVRRGEIVSVEPDRLSLKVEEGGGDVGETITLRTTEFTSVQVGMNFVSKPGRKADLTEWFKTGDYVDVLARDGRILALHREFRPGETATEEVYGPDVRSAPDRPAPEG